MQGREFSADNDYIWQGEFSTYKELYESDKTLELAPQDGDTLRPFKLQWPVRKIQISRGFSDEGKNSHLGIDLRGQKGDPIFAAHDGIVIYARSGFRGYGRMVILEYDKTWATLYGHLSRYTVKTGQKIHVGDVIGLMGRTGRATGVHLHFELMRDKIPIDPKSQINPSDSIAKTN